MDNEKSWIAKEFEELDLNDIRLNNRFMDFFTQLYENPSKTINGSFSGMPELKASYRLIGNEKVSADSILSPHIQRINERMNDHQIILHAQDTSEMNFNQRAPIKGMGKLRGENDQGFFIHTTIAVTPDKICLGIIQNKTFVREKIQTKEERKINKTKDIEEKESNRWLESFRLSDQVAKENPDKIIINISDREGDFYELFREALNTQEGAELIKGRANFIIRAKRNRTTSGPELESTEEPFDQEKQIEELSAAQIQANRKIINIVKKTAPVGTLTFKIPSNHKGRTARTVTQVVRFKRMKIEPPLHLKEKYNPVYVNAVVCTENNPPKGQKAIEWMLFTSLPLGSEFSALKIVEFYLCRWMIELIFKILKSGCKVEKLQFEDYEKYVRCVAVYLIISWRILMLTMIGRACPELPCTVLYDVQEWKAACLVKKKEIPKSAPSLQEMTLMVAGFGGFTQTKKSGEPGIQTMWTGLQKLASYVEALESAGIL